MQFFDGAISDILSVHVLQFGYQFHKYTTSPVLAFVTNDLFLSSGDGTLA
jgi:hypothetical protein